MSGALTLAVDELVDTDVTMLCDSEIRETYLDVRRDIDRLEASAARMLAAAHRRGIPAGDGAASTPAWVEAHTGQRWSDAKASLDTGLACETLPLTAKAWMQGEISASAARTIAAGRPDGHETAYADVEETLVDYAAGRNWRDLRAMIAHCRRCADALDDREPADRNGLHLSKSGDRWMLSGDFDDLAGTIIEQAIAAATDKPTDDDTRSAAKRRADGLERIGRYFLDHEDLPVEAGEAPHVSLVIGWETVRDGLTARSLPTIVGPSLSPAQVGAMLCDAHVSRVVLGPDSRPLDVGREYRTAPRWIRRAIAARDKGCRYPGCGRRPSWCHAHHVKPWETGGETTVANLVLLCSYHHHIVHKPGWTATFDGVTFTVTNPDGRTIGATSTRRDN
jgi:5-methylcytosine-specific restriction protein A